MMKFKSVLPPEDEKQAIRDRVANIVGVPGPIRDLLSDPDKMEKDGAGFCADMVEEMYVLAAKSSAVSYPHWPPSHVHPVAEGAAIKMDNDSAPAPFQVVKTRMVPNPEPPPDEIEQRYYDQGPTLGETIGSPWIVRKMTVSIKVNSVDARTVAAEEQQTFVAQCLFTMGASTYAFDIGCGWHGDENTRTYYEVES